jgi:2-phosphoglycerate kinase
LAKLLIEDKEEATRVPFLRGILTRSLQQSGLSFQQAYHLAADVRLDLEDKAVVSKLELHRLVYRKLKKEYGEQVADRYLRPYEFRPHVQVRDREGRLTPFSSELHRRDLETIGLTLGESLKVATKLRRRLFRDGASEVSTQYIGRLTYELLGEMRSLGPAVAHRWLLWRDFVHSGRPLVLVIGGTTGCGKSTVATAVAHRLDIVRMQSTDLLREVMRSLLASDDYPELHHHSFDAWRALAEGDDDRVRVPADGTIEKAFRAQVELVSSASRAVIERALRERVSLIIEGVHAHPLLAADLDPGDALIVHIMLAVLKKRKLKQRITGRATEAVQRRAQEYLAHFDEIWALQAYLLAQADGTNTPIIVNENRDEVVREMMRTLLDELAKSSNPSAAQVFAE